MTPFWLPKLVAIAAGAVFVFGSEARRRIKLLVACAVLLSLVLQHGPAPIVAWTAGLLLQVVVGVFVLVHFRSSR
jgi:hypothetical protein